MWGRTRNQFESIIVPCNVRNIGVNNYGRRKYSTITSDTRAHRDVATKLLKEADELLASTSATTLEDESKTKLNTLKQQINCKLAKLNEVDEKILGLCDVKDIGAEVSESEEYTAKVTSCIIIY